MSRKKYTFNLNFGMIIPRLLKSANISQYNELAEILEISSQAISNFKKKGFFPANLLVKFAVENKISLDKILDLKTNSCEIPISLSEIPYAERELSGMKDEIKKVIVQVRTCWARSAFGDSQNNLIAWQMNSDNMSPTISRNDFLLIDTRVNKIEGSGVYAFSQKKRVLIRRILERMDGQIELINENPSYGNFNRSFKTTANIEFEDLKILGRVIFIGKML